MRAGSAAAAAAAAAAFPVAVRASWEAGTGAAVSWSVGAVAMTSALENYINRILPTGGNAPGQPCGRRERVLGLLRARGHEGRAGAESVCYSLQPADWILAGCAIRSESHSVLGGPVKHSERVQLSALRCLLKACELAFLGPCSCIYQSDYPQWFEDISVHKQRDANSK